MSLPPQKLREIVFQMLFSQEFAGSEGEGTALLLMGELKVAKRFVLQAREKAEAIQAKQDDLDQKIREASKEYTLERISRVEKTILRLGLFEMLYDDTIPPKIAIAEAIRLTRKFGTPESAHFVNAILDCIYKHETAEQPVPQ